MIARLLDELALAGPEHLDPGYVGTYEWKAAFDPAADLALLRERGFGAGSTLLELGAGTGTLAVAAASECDRVIATDVSPAMVAAIHAKAVDHGITNLECVQGGFLSYEHSEELEAHLRNEHSTFTWLLEPMIQRAGLEMERAAHDALRVYANYICVKPSH